MSIPPDLQRSPIIASLSREDALKLAAYLDQRSFAAGATVVREGESDRKLHFVLAGHARLARGGMALETIGPGDHFGELSLLSGRPRAASVVASEPLTVARLDRPQWERLVVAEPAVALHLLTGLVGRLGVQLVTMTENVGLLLRERSLPRRTSIEVQVGGARRAVPMGTAVGAVLPPGDDDAALVAALVDRKPVALNTPLTADAIVEALDTRSWEGREVFRRSAGLLLLEAAYQALPALALKLGPSLSSAQLVELPAGASPLDVAARLGPAMRALAARDAAFVEEQWTVEEAQMHFSARGWSDASALLRTWRDPTVPLVTCGSVYALSLAPLLPRTGLLADVSLREHRGSLLLDFGERLARHLPAGVREVGEPSFAPQAPRDLAASGFEAPRSPSMVVDHKAWLSTLGVTSVGTYNDRCIAGEVSELIRAAEGFHEKRIGSIADRIRDRGAALRVICIAGPSSSGKTTFIKRLTVQLQIDGVLPRAISLDDYYVDRELSPKTEAGAYDFEALEALDLGLLQAHLGALVAGETVKTARYDFRAGKSLRDAGPSLALGPREVLMLEGIHGLNPALLGGAVAEDRVYRIFIHPVVGLPFDRLTSASPADVRLLRRIVRDRHHRGLNAAESIARWPAVRDGERRHIFPFLPEADTVFDASLAYEVSVLKVYADRYLLEVPREHASYTTAYRLRRFIDRFVTIYPDHVPPTSILREFIGGSGFEY